MKEETNRMISREEKLTRNKSKVIISRWSLLILHQFLNL